MVICAAKMAEHFIRNTLNTIPDNFSKPDIFYKFYGSGANTITNSDPRIFAEIYLRDNAKNRKSNNKVNIEMGVRFRPNFHIDKNSIFLRLNMKNSSLFFNGRIQEMTALFFTDELSLFQLKDESINFLKWILYQSSKSSLSVFLDSQWKGTLKIIANKLNLIGTISLRDIWQAGWRNIKTNSKFAFFVPGKFSFGIENRYFYEEDSKINFFFRIPVSFPSYKNESIFLMFKSNFRFSSDSLIGYINFQRRGLQLSIAFNKEGFQLLSILVKNESIGNTLKKNKYLFMNHEMKKIKIEEVRYV
jgi:hypothetical protein